MIFDEVVKTVGGYFKSAAEVDALFFDNQDYHGLVYWYEYIIKLKK